MYGSNDMNIKRQDGFNLGEGDLEIRIMWIRAAEDRSSSHSNTGIVRRVLGGVGRAELWGVSKQLKIPPGVGLRGGVKFLIYFVEGGGGGGQPGNPSGYTLGYSASLMVFANHVLRSLHLMIAIQRARYFYPFHSRR